MIARCTFVAGLLAGLTAAEAGAPIPGAPAPPPTPPSRPSPFSHKVTRHEGETGGDRVEAGRSGTTVELGVGVGVAHVRDEGSEPEARRSLAPSLSLGTWLDENNVLALRIATQVFKRSTSADADLRTIAVFAGPAIQHWFGDTAFLGGGFGLLILDDKSRSSSAGVELRAGAVLGRAGASVVHASIEGTLGMREYGLASHVALGLGFQRW